MKIRKAVIPAAGRGTRFLPVTKSQPKEMLPVAGKPLIQYSVEEAVACGAELVVIVTAAGKTSIEDYFDRSPELEAALEKEEKADLAQELRQLSSMADIAYVRQKRQLGLGHAVLTAKSLVGPEPFLLLLPDDLFEKGEAVLKSLMRVHDERGGSVIAAMRVTEDKVSQYGVVRPVKLAERVYKATDLVEKPKPGEVLSNLAIMGRYVLSPEVFETLEATPPGRLGEIQLTDALKRLALQGSVFAYEFEGERYDAGTLLGWLQTTLAFAMKDPELGPALTTYFETLRKQSPPGP